MILVDTTIWIDYFRDRPSPHADRVDKALEDQEVLAISGLVLTEILQGVRSETEAKKVMMALRPLRYLSLNRHDYLLAAALYRKARSQGQVIRKTNDCLIAACAISYGAAILTTDGDFGKIAAVSPLKLVQV